MPKPSEAKKFWDYTEAPFVEKVLRDDQLNSMFVNRADELDELRVGVDGPLVTLCGEYGSGKSTLLRKFEQVLVGDDFHVAFIQLGFSKEETVYSDMLAALQENLIGASFKTDSKYKEPKSDGAACDQIVKLCEKQQEGFVVIVDNLGRVGDLFRENEEGYKWFVEQVATTIEDSFAQVGTAFVLVLNGGFTRLLKEIHEQGDGQLSIGQSVEIGNFRPEAIKELVQARLNYAGMDNNIFNLIEEDALRYVWLCTAGHVRKIIKLLRLAMNRAARDKAKPITIDLVDQVIKHVTRSTELRDGTIKVKRYLANYGSTYASDPELAKQTALSRQTLGQRLESLASEMELSVTQEGGRSKRIVYRVPSFTD